MSKNNLIRKSDKKFIRLEKARIRKQFFDVEKQQEMINELYKRFIKTKEPKEAKVAMPKTEKTKKAESEKLKEKVVHKKKIAKIKWDAILQGITPE